MTVTFNESERASGLFTTCAAALSSLLEMRVDKARLLSILGPRLRARREEQGIGLRELARRLNMSPSALSQLETGKTSPSVSTLRAIAAELGISLDELFSNHRA